jgi:hypothetical protein
MFYNPVYLRIHLRLIVTSNKLNHLLGMGQKELFAFPSLGDCYVVKSMKSKFRKSKRK